MAEHSLAQPAPTPATPREIIAERIDVETARLRERRPHLDRRIERATNLLVAHLSSPGAVIRVRVGAGDPRFLVASLNDRGAVYTVNPGSWACSCPDFHRNNSPCKHAICCFVLWRLAQCGRSYGAVNRREVVGCPICRNGIVHVGQAFVNRENGEIRERTLALPCKRCGGTG